MNGDLKITLEKSTLSNKMLPMYITALGVENITIDILKRFKDIPQSWGWRNVSSSKSITMKDIEENVDLPWDWNDVCENPNLTIDFIRQFKDIKPLNWINISKNLSISLTDIETNLDLPWNMGSICYREDLTIDFINRHLMRFSVGCIKDMTPRLLRDNPRIRIDWRWLCYAKNLTIDIVLDNLDKPWNWRELTRKFSLEIIDRYPTLSWHWLVIDEFHTLNIDFVLRHRDRLNIYNSTSNKGITITDIENNVDLGWNWREVSMKEGIKMSFVKQHLTKTLDWYGISCSTSITLKDIEDNIDLPWIWKSVSKNLNLTIHFVKKYRNKDWDWDQIVKNPNIDIEDIENLDDSYKLNWNQFMHNPNLTLPFLLKHLDKPLHTLTQNFFLYNDHAYTKTVKKEIENRRQLLSSIDIVNDVKKYVLNYYVGYQ